VSGLDYLTTGFYGTNAGAAAGSALTAGLAGPQIAALDAAAGKFRYTFPATGVLPAGATGTYAFGVESRFVESQNGVTKPAATDTPLFFKAVGDTAGAARPQVASNDKCNACHVELGFHSNRERIGVQYCGTCHNPNLDNRGRVRFPTGTTGYEVESVDIGVMSHRIHTGAELPSVQAGGQIVYGTQRTGDAPADANFSTFAMPPSNSTERCLTCHEAGTWGLPAEGRLPVKRSVMACGTDATTAGDCAGTTATGRTVTTELRVPRATAICTSCHDGAPTIAHAELNTIDPNGVRWSGDEIETCNTCHGPGKEWDSLRVHPGETP
jgi:OmcA/MtrC family decaheme c-type cytochrome